MFNSRKTILGMIVALLIIAITVPAFAGDGVTVKVNGSVVDFPDQEPFIANSRTFVPLRFVSEALGGKVDWEGSTQTAIVDRGVHVEMKIGSKTPTVNGMAKALDAPARLTNGRTMVPLRFVSEALGAEVIWDGSTRTVVINDNGAGVENGGSNMPTPEEVEEAAIIVGFFIL